MGKGYRSTIPTNVLRVSGLRRSTTSEEVRLQLVCLCEDCLWLCSRFVVVSCSVVLVKIFASGYGVTSMVMDMDGVCLHPFPLAILECIFFAVHILLGVTQTASKTMFSMRATPYTFPISSAVSLVWPDRPCTHILPETRTDLST